MENCARDSNLLSFSLISAELGAEEGVFVQSARVTMHGPVSAISEVEPCFGHRKQSALIRRGAGTAGKVYHLCGMSSVVVLLRHGQRLAHERDRMRPL
jgi:hypothetical protein